MVKTICMKADNGAIAIINTSVYSTVMVVTDKDGNIIIDKTPFKCVRSAKCALKKIAHNWVEGYCG